MARRTDKPKGKSKYALKVQKRRADARALGLPVDATRPVIDAELARRSRMQAIGLDPDYDKCPEVLV